ncbi:hypothetical protein BV372_31055 [Nostoc sp. T09]|nr:hypothetical protein BV372_31055 [Nostoc sp. T09]
MYRSVCLSPPLELQNWSFVIGYLSFVICHLSLVIGQKGNIHAWFLPISLVPFLPTLPTLSHTSRPSHTPHPLPHSPHSPHSLITSPPLV